MRIPSFPSLVRTLYAFSNVTIRAFPHTFRNLNPANSPFRPTALKSLSMPLFGSLFSSSSSKKMDYPLKKSDDEWQAVLSPEQFRVLRKQGTEAPHTGKYDKHHPSAGTYACAGCGAALYHADHKFKSGCGWPAFFDAVPGAVTRHTDRSLGMARTEIVCSNCGGHLGHVFKGEGYSTPTDERHCVNSVSLRFAADDAAKGEGAKEGDKAESKV